MPRTIDSLVECHRIASERRSSGRPAWDRKISVRPILQRDQGNESEEHAAAVANEIAALLRARLPTSMIGWEHTGANDVLTEIVEGMESLRPNSYSDDPSYSALEDLNSMLDQLYDWADRERVWLG